ncbi:MAG: germination protein YpeB, partial [Clostridia bacterium]|nr:germination protein YpeB [Clostridia bacterium]
MENEINTEKQGERGARTGRKGGFSKRLRLIFCWIVPGILTAALIFAVVWGVKQRREADSLRTNGEGLYRRTYQELTESVYDLHNSLSKLLVSEAPNTIAMTLDEIWRESGAISALMSRIPQNHPDNYALNRFLVQTGDYARQLTASVLAGGTLSDPDRSQLVSLWNASRGVYEELLDTLNGGNFPMAALTSAAFYDRAEGTEPAEQTEQPYPSIDYDGPFSDSTENRLPAAKGDPIDEETALRRAIELLADAELASKGSCSGRPPSYLFGGRLKDGREVDIALTANGGELIWFMTSPVGAEEGAPEDGRLAEMAERGRQWLESAGYGSMEPVSVRYCTGAAAIAFAPVERLHDGAEV